MTNTLQASAPQQVEVKPEDAIEPLTVSLATAARLLGVSDRHIRSHLHEIPHIRLGGRLLFQVESLRRWLADRDSQ
jgi:excisionase family DNA binding protein